MLSVVRTKAFAIRDLPLPLIAAPDAPPVLLPALSATVITWRGVTGATSYSVECAPTGKGPWTGMAEGVTDDRDKGSPLYSDPGGKVGESYYYRVRAGNAVGSSGYSNIVGPVGYGTAK